MHRQPFLFYTITNSSADQWLARFDRVKNLMTGLNAGVWLLNLRRLRSSSWTRDVVCIYEQYADRLLYSDQDVINIYFARRSGKYVMCSG